MTYVLCVMQESVLRP